MLLRGLAENAIPCSAGWNELPGRPVKRLVGRQGLGRRGTGAWARIHAARIAAFLTLTLPSEYQGQHTANEMTWDELASSGQRWTLPPRMKPACIRARSRNRFACSSVDEASPATNSSDWTSCSLVLGARCSISSRYTACRGRFNICQPGSRFVRRWWTSRRPKFSSARHRRYGLRRTASTSGRCGFQCVRQLSPNEKLLPPVPTLWQSATAASNRAGRARGTVEGEGATFGEGVAKTRADGL